MFIILYQFPKCTLICEKDEYLVCALILPGVCMIRFRILVLDFFFLRDSIWLGCLGWRAVAQSQFMAASDS